MKLSVVIPHYWAEREGNLRTIVKALYAGSVAPNEIIIWNNGSPLEPIAGAEIIQAPRNYGCLGRFIASFAARGEYVLFQDNDTCVTRDTVLQLLLAAQDIPNSICSIDGWSFTDDKTYTNGVKTLRYGFPIGGPGTGVEEPTRVDVTPGHMELVRRGDLGAILSWFPFEDKTVMEDLWFNACANKADVQRYVVPCQFKYLSECGVGICQAPDFFAERDRLCQDIF